MTLLYNRIKEEGRREGLAMARAEAMEKRIAEGRETGRAEGKREGFVVGVDATLEAMREVGLDEETRRRLEDALARRVWRNMRNAL